MGGYMTKELLYYGPPGTGKTQNISNLIRGCIEEGIPPERIACVSFTRKAASESRERVCKDWGLTEDMLPYFQTLHSMAFHTGGYKSSDVISKKDLEEIGYEVGLSFSARDGGDTDFDMLGISDGDTYLNLHHLARSKRRDLEEIYSEASNYDLNWSVLQRLIISYENFKSVRGKIDFTDMIEEFVKRDEPLDIDALFVDEAQDLSTLQWNMISVLRRTPRIQIFTGDDDQAIMGFQGADVHAFQNCTPNKEVLTQSYRVPQEPYGIAQDIVRRIEGRAPKVWYPTKHSGSVRWHNSIYDVPLEEGEWCLLARTNKIASHYANQLREEGWVYSRFGHPSIPPKMYDAILSWENWTEGHPLGVDQIKNIYNYMNANVGYLKGYGPRSKTFLNREEGVMFSMDQAHSELGLCITEGRWHEVLGKIDDETRHYVLNALRRGDNVKHPRIKISTIHSMKGGECDNIIVIPDLSPAAYREYRKTPETEHRVFYVAVTRAKKALHLLEPFTESKQFYEI
jgi:superfamily I DNA/RNA helicase